MSTYFSDKTFAKTMEAWRKRADAEPNNPEAWHTIGVYYQDKVLRDKTLPKAQALDYTMKGIAAEDQALSINPEYYEALVYKNILLHPFLGGLSDEARTSLGAAIPFPARLGDPGEYAALVAHIVGNPVLNGEVIRLDGALRMAPR